MERSSVLTGRAWGSGQQHLSGPDLTPARPHLPGEPREKWKMGKMGKIGSAQPGSISSMPCHSPCAVLERGLQPPRAFLLPLGNITAPDLEAFFGKCHQLAMSQSWLSAACPVPGVGLCPRAPPCCSLRSHLPAHTQRLCWQGQSRGLGLPRPCLASWSPGDRRTDGQTDTLMLQLPSPGRAFPALRAFSELPAQVAPVQGSGWKSAGKLVLQTRMCPGVLEGKLQLQKKKNQNRNARAEADGPTSRRRMFMGFFTSPDGSTPLCLEKGVYGIFLPL